MHLTALFSLPKDPAAYTSLDLSASGKEVPCSIADKSSELSLRHTTVRHGKREAACASLCKIEVQKQASRPVACVEALWYLFNN